jgi:hypothetical protein
MLIILSKFGIQRRLNAIFGIWMGLLKANLGEQERGKNSRKSGVYKCIHEYFERVFNKGIAV